ncbi:lysine methyltransferase [Marinicella litoralis]|uniref:Lysine methyltransferase n=2 Tax=Marinicella litoralis TaxID=644220 RepID=A0A4R6XU15_9GAMM|nr:lysine methyltransferase [Marinicella litoralis]
MPNFRIKFQTLEFSHIDIHFKTLRSNQEFADPEGVAASLGISSAQWPLFGVVWESSQVLAHLMDDLDTGKKRILEVGCGIGLSSLLLNARGAAITATDYHPEVGEFLIGNAALNEGRKIPYLRTSWDNQNTGLGQFDLIIGSDLLYEKEHVELLSQFIHRHAKLQCEVILVDPGRGFHAKFSKAMILLGYSHKQSHVKAENYLSENYSGQILRYAKPA